MLDKACIEQCPVDCNYESERALYIYAGGGVDCGAGEPVRLVEAIWYEDDVPQKWSTFTADAARFFTEPLPGQPGVPERLGWRQHGRVGRYRYVTGHRLLATQLRKGTRMRIVATGATPVYRASFPGRTQRGVAVG